MKKTTFLPLFLLAVGMTVLAGCDPTLDLGNRKVQFTAVSKSGPSTKTVYGDIASDSYQRIKWVSGDKIRIYSPDTNISIENENMPVNQEPTGSTNTGTITWTETPPQFDLNYYYADYEIDQVKDSAIHYHAASLKNVGGNGLTWVGTGSATFYAAYPYNTLITANNDKKLRFAVKVPGGNGNEPAGSQSGDSTAVSGMSLLAKSTVSSGSPVKLDFYPAFSAFQFVLKSADSRSLTLNSFELVSSSTSDKEWLTGYCYYDLNSTTIAEGNSPFLANSALSFEGTTDNPLSKSLKINLNQTITDSQEANFTLFTLPSALSNLSIKVTFTPDGGSQTTKTLKLQKKNNSGVMDWISFPAGHKARILGLALEGGSKWQLTIDDQVLPWIADEETTSFRHNIGIKNQVFDGFITTDPLYIYEDIDNTILRSTTPYYEGQPVSPDNYYYLNNGRFTKNGYYLRLTTKIQGEDDPCITYTFTPTAPIGGYWSLAPEAVEGSLDYFRITVDDGINGESERLQGQVMGLPVTIFIRPTAAYLALENAPVCSCIIKCNMSPSATWDPLYSADSEFQGVHTDGSFSYYKYRIAK